MSDIRRVLARMESDFDFYLAVVGDPRAALAPFTLNQEEVEAFAHPGMPLWNLVLRHTARESPGAPDGGLPPPPPPFVVHYSIPTAVERWLGDREADLIALRADPAVQAAIRTVEAASTLPNRSAAVAQLVERIG
jgi:hypothetical protein